MDNFTYYNPVRVIFGRSTIAGLSQLVPKGRILVTYGGGSIKTNGVYDQVRSALAGFDVTEFSGIEPNPRYETLMKAVRICRDEGIDFLLAVGGGSVLDGTKFIAAAACYDGPDPWDIPRRAVTVDEALPLGAVLTLPATGSEMNTNAVISREATREKLAFSSSKLFPVFSILDPETTFSLSRRQTANGIADAFVHVAEQYLTYVTNAPLQARQSEAVLMTLVEEGPKALANPRDYDARANVMWCATNALNGLLGCGVPGDWTSHMIGHELTAFTGMDHGQSLSVVLPAVLRHQAEKKASALVRYAERVWGLKDRDGLALRAVEKTEEFFRSLGLKTRLSELAVSAEVRESIVARFAERGAVLGEQRVIGPREVGEILELAARR